MNIICGRCKDSMCDDCRLIAEEYEQLLANYKRANWEGSERVKKLERDLAEAKSQQQPVHDAEKFLFERIRSAFSTMRGEVRSKEQVLLTLDIIRLHLLGVDGNDTGIAIDA